MMQHVTINTADLDTSVAFYRDVVGLKVKADMRETAGMPIVFLWAEEGGTCVELIQNAQQAYCGSGISIGFHVENVEDTHDVMEKRGLNPSAIVSPNPKTKFFFVKDPNGLNIQFI